MTFDRGRIEGVPRIQKNDVRATQWPHERVFRQAWPDHGIPGPDGRQVVGESLASLRPVDDTDHVHRTLTDVGDPHSDRDRLAYASRSPRDLQGELQRTGHITLLSGRAFWPSRPSSSVKSANSRAFSR